MKPRTKIEIDVMKSNKELPSITNEMFEWAKTQFQPNVAYATKNRAICMNCGEKFSTKDVHRNKAVCPNCSSKLRIEHTHKSTLKDRYYITYLDIFNGYQIVRNFEYQSNRRAGRQPYYSCYEVLQEWIRDDGKMVVVSRLHSAGFNSTYWHGDLEVRRSRGYSYVIGTKYYVYPDKYHPKSRIKKQYRKYGISTKLQGFTASEAIRIIPEHPKAETLLKAKQFQLVYYFDNFEKKISKYWTSIKICLRNNYYINDSRMWFDYLELLEACGKDLRNAHYVCPIDLKEAHDKYMAIRRKAIDKEKEIERRKKAEESERAYQSFIRRFEGLLISDGEVVVEPLKSVAEFMHEGDEMHHCVFTNAYYEEKDSLILSARINNERLETIQFDLKSLKVVQSRGKFNGTTDYHDKIIQLVEKNYHKIKFMNENALVLC